ncbi:MAG: T9SS type A sorting domain-containing protein [Chlorobi bacterium]|nr:T9SS type A sorting domain-containing protein [Chlorobiota bacterium]
MKKIYTLLALVLAGFSGTAQTLSPEVIATAGGYYNAGNLSLSWTAGEVAVTTLQNGSLVLTQGFQQPEGVATGVNDRFADWENRIWPNPVKEEVMVGFNMKTAGAYILTLTDITGRKLQVVKTPVLGSGQQVTLDMRMCRPGIYFLRITAADSNRSRVFKLIKE